MKTVEYSCGCVETINGKYTGLKKQCCLLTYNLDSQEEMKCIRLEKYRKLRRKRNGNT